MMVTNNSSISTETVLFYALEALVSAIDARNNIRGHSMRVASYAVQIAKAAGWNDQVVERIRIGALLHDIGQIYWPNRLLDKQESSLTEEEREIIESHIIIRLQLVFESLSLSGSSLLEINQTQSLIKHWQGRWKQVVNISLRG